MNSYRSSFLDSIPPVVKNLIAINVIMWLATIALPPVLRRWGIDADLTDILGMHYWAADKFNPAQLMTYMFMHWGIGHVFFNMFALYMFGGVLENYWGPRRFFIYYMVTGVGAGIVQQLFWTVEYHSVVSALFLNLPVTVGASGSVFGLLLAFGWLFPDVRLMMLFFPVPIRARVFVILYGVAELFLGVANFSGDSVAHFAHLGGMLFGIVLILIWKKNQFKTW